MDRIIRMAALGVASVLLLAWGALWIADEAGNPLAGRAIAHVGAFVGIGSPEESGASSAVAGVPIGGSFHLVDQTGTPVTDATYRGRWRLMYFGYTFCPDLCPTALQTIAAALHKLGPMGRNVVPIFVSVDPARDTPAVLAKYVRLFGDRFVGLTGTPAEIAQVAHAFRVYYAAESATPGEPYAVDHSSFAYLMDPQGRLAALFNQDTSADDMAARIRDRLSGNS
jgi:cytochrome oxidase Cu insertion factor (SCO1/SenC/PrrC family)